MSVIAPPQWHKRLIRQREFLASLRKRNPSEIDMAIAALDPDQFSDENYEKERLAISTEYRRRAV
jgi:hypothetical protein